MAQFLIESIPVGEDAPPLVVAEIGANHDGDLSAAEQMLHRIAKTGAKAVKFQTYTAEELVADPQRLVKTGAPGQEQQETIGDLFKRVTLPREAHADLFQLARELGLVPFSTPFSEEGVDFLMELNVPCFKVAASDVNHLPMLRHLATTGKPVILSLGKCSLPEADMAIATLLEHGCQDLCILHCISQYPAPMDELNLRVIPSLIQLYPECVVGFSDHSIGTTAAIASVALGAKLIEKHVTLSQTIQGPDHWFSLDMVGLEELVTSVHHAHIALGHPRKRVVPCEQNERQTSTRSLVIRRSLKSGQRIQKDDLKVTRPGTGIAPMFLDAVVGMAVSQDVPENTVLQWDLFK